MKALKYIAVLVLLLSLIVPTAFSEEEPNMPDIGTLYGDLYVILRDEYGVPILHEKTVVSQTETVTVWCIQPISSKTASVVIPILDEDGEEDELTVSVDEGEPFALPSYIDRAGDLVECELTEEMLLWVIPVDFGRLNLGRAPDGVIAHAFDEAVNKMNAAKGIGIDPAGRLVLTLPDPLDPDNEELDIVKTIDAPAENLALYIKMMFDGHWITPEDTETVLPGGRPEGQGKEVDEPADSEMPDDVGRPIEYRPVLNCWEEYDSTPSQLQVQLTLLGYGGLCDDAEVWDDDQGWVAKTGENLSREELLLAASLLAAAADKTGNMTLDKVVYINSIYGINQIGTWPGPTEGERYFNFWLELGDPGSYDRASHYEYRSSGGCDAGEIWVLQPELELYDPDPNDEDPGQLVPVGDHYVTECMDILGNELAEDDENYQANAVNFTHMVEGYYPDANGVDELVYDFTDNVRAFVQASEDALRVLEYLHNYKTPEDLYGVYPDQ